MASEDAAGSSTALQDALYRAYVGPKAAAYLAYFTGRDAGGSWISWHWPSMFAAFHWALYRKQWGYALSLVLIGFLGLLALVFHAAALANASAEQVTTFNVVWLLVAIAAFLIPPLVTKPLYHRAARAAIASTAHVDAAAERLQAVARRGGTSSKALATGLVLTFLVPVGLIVLGR